MKLTKRADALFPQMKIGVFLEGFSPDSGGGHTIQFEILQSLLELAGESRHTFSVICRNPNDLAPLLKSSSIETISFPGSIFQRVVTTASQGLTAWKNRRKRQTILDDLVKRNGIDFVWFLGAEAIQLDSPYCAVVWDLQHRLQPWFPEVSAAGKWEQRERFAARFLRRATVVIVGTRAGREELERFYDVPAERILVLSHPTPRFALETSAGDDREVLVRHGLSPGYLFYPAQFWPHKNHANLLFALARLRESEVRLEMVFVGSDKGNEPYVRSLVQSLGLSQQVHFLGFVPQPELPAFYRNALALTYLSFFGPENLPPLEAFGFGCPVIAANVSGSSEQLGDAALLVDPGDVDQIVAAIKALRDDPELATTLVARGRERALVRTGDHFVRGMFSFLDEFENIRRCWPR
jgi:glycosyltransferase involved in cell wall biosynthesis